MYVFSQGMSPYGEEVDEKKEEQSVNVVELPFDGSSADGSYGEEKGYREKPRPIILTQAIMTGITLILVVGAMGSGWRQMAIEIAADQSYIRLALLVVVPIQVWLALVSSSYVVNNMVVLILISSVIVFHAVRCRLRIPAHRPYQSNGLEFKILLWFAASSTC